MRLVGFFPILTVFGKKTPALKNTALQLNKSRLLAKEMPLMDRVDR